MSSPAYNKRPYRRILETVKADSEEASARRDKYESENPGNRYEIDCLYQEAFMLGCLVNDIERLIKWEGKL